MLVIIKDNKSQFVSNNNEVNKGAELREYGVGAQILRDLESEKCYY